MATLTRSIPRLGGKAAKKGTKAWIGAKGARKAGKAWLGVKAAKTGARASRTGTKALFAGKAFKRAATPRRAPSRTRVVLMGAAGAAAEYFLDPVDGKRRRHVARDKATKVLRRGSRKAAAQAQYAAGVAQGKVAGARPSEPKHHDDVTLAHKVETEIFRAPDAPKGSVDVNAEHGVVYLRGEVETTERAEELAEAARQVEGVKSVKNLLHTPGTPAPQSS
jgi:osmotically-inducible protein OsmY